MYAAAGVILLLSSAAALGRGLGQREKRYIQALTQAAELLHHIRRRVDLFSTPCREILADAFTPDGVRYTEERIQALSQEMGKEGILLRSFFEKLGSGYREDTLRLCDDTLSRLQQRLTAAEKEYPARLKLYTAMPLLIAVSILVLIL